MKNNITTLRSTRAAVASDLEGLTHLAKLTKDLREGRGCVIMMGHCAVSIAIKGQEYKVIPDSLVKVRRFTKEEAQARVNAMPNPALFRVLPFSAAISAQQTLMESSLTNLDARIAQVMEVQS